MRDSLPTGFGFVGPHPELFATQEFSDTTSFLVRRSETYMPWRQSQWASPMKLCKTSTVGTSMHITYGVSGSSSSSTSIAAAAPFPFFLRFGKSLQRV